MNYRQIIIKEFTRFDWTLSVRGEVFFALAGRVQLGFGGQSCWTRGRSVLGHRRCALPVSFKEVNANNGNGNKLSLWLERLLRRANAAQAAAGRQAQGASQALLCPPLSWPTKHPDRRAHILPAYGAPPSKEPYARWGSFQYLWQLVLAGLTSIFF